MITKCLWRFAVVQVISVQKGEVEVFQRKFSCLNLTLRQWLQSCNLTFLLIKHHHITQTSSLNKVQREFLRYICSDMPLCNVFSQKFWSFLCAAESCEVSLLESLPPCRRFDTVTEQTGREAKTGVKSPELPMGEEVVSKQNYVIFLPNKGHFRKLLCFDWIALGQWQRLQLAHYLLILHDGAGD